MKRAIGKPTKAQQARHDRLREFGCVCCWLDSGITGTPASIHHINDTGRNISHDATIPLCARHHQGHDGGPGIHSHPLEFRGTYGTELELLETVNSEADA